MMDTAILKEYKTPRQFMWLVAMIACIFTWGNTAQAQCERQAMACNNLVYVTLNQDCEAIIRPDMIIEGFVGEDDDYEVRIFDPEGNRIETDTLREDYDCQRLKVEVECLRSTSGAVCWGYIIVEDKIAPEICISPEDTSITCAVYDFMLDPREFLTKLEFSDQGSCDKPDSVEITNDTMIVQEECSDTVAIICRTFTVFDKSKNRNSASVKQRIALLRADFDDFIYPNDTTIECNDVGDLSVEALGEPKLLACEPYFEIFMEEKEFRAHCRGERKITREWTIIDPCRNRDTVFTQTIEVIDTTPAFIDLSEFDINQGDIKASKEYCTAVIERIPQPQIKDACDTLPHIQVCWSRVDSEGVPFGECTFAEMNDTETLDLPRVPLCDPFVLIWTVTDDCDNVIRDTTEVYTIDDPVQPNTICEEETIVSLNNAGMTEVTAESLDDHSFDNCGIVRREVRRPDNVCPGFGSDFSFGPSVHFCCDDASRDSVRVILRVYDKSDNYNECIINVRVQDKRTPNIICPQPDTLDCMFGFDTLRQYLERRPPELLWACDNGELTLDIPEVNIPECGGANFFVTWTATDANGTSRSCTQRIVVMTRDGAVRVQRPSQNEFDVFTCNGGTDPDDIPNSQPRVFNNGCGEVIVDHEDIVLHPHDPENSSYCSKINRTWTIYDWCEFQNGNLETAIIDRFVQVIKLYDSEAPELSTDRNNFIVEDEDASCAESVTVAVEVMDDCTSPEDIQVAYTVYEDGDMEEPVLEGEGTSFTSLFEPGEYTATFIATDHCGNKDTLDVNFTVVGTKKPTPVFFGNYTVSLGASGTSTIVAREFNQKSINGCTETEDNLRYAFSSNPADSMRTYTCADIPNGINATRDIEVFVIDANGLFNSAEVTIEIEDNNNRCEDVSNGTAMISGSIRNEHGDAVANIAVNAFSQTTGEQYTANTDDKGVYALDPLPMNHHYELSADLQGYDHYGVTTLDMLYIQRHILGLQVLDSPYKIIASDVNNDRRVSGSDLIQLRLLILGKTTNMGVDNSWRFIPSETTFEEVLLPWEYTDVKTIDDLDHTMLDQDFIAIKVGDVDGNAFEALALEKAKSRTSKPWSYSMEHGDMYTTIDIQPEFSNIVYGMQFELQVDEALELVAVEGLTLEAEENVYAQSGSVRLSWHEMGGYDLQSNDGIKLIFRRQYDKVTWEEPQVVSTPELPAQLYDESMRIYDIQMRKRQAIETSVAGDFVLNQNHPNPFTQQTAITFDLAAEDDVILSISDMNGVRVHAVQRHLKMGQHTIYIHADDLPGEGIYYYTLESSTAMQTRKMVILK